MVAFGVPAPPRPPPPGTARLIPTAPSSTAPGSCWPARRTGRSRDPLGGEGPPRRGRPRHRCRQPGAGGPDAARGHHRPGRRPTARRRRRRDRAHGDRRAGVLAVGHQRAPRHAPQPGAAGPRAGRVVGRLGGRRRQRGGPPGRRHRHGRVGAGAGVLLRGARVAAHPRAGAPRRRGTAVAVVRHRRPLRPPRRRRAPGDGRRRHGRVGVDPGRAALLAPWPAWSWPTTSWPPSIPADAASIANAVARLAAALGVGVGAPGRPAGGPRRRHRHLPHAPGRRGLALPRRARGDRDAAPRARDRRPLPGRLRGHARAGGGGRPRAGGDPPGGGGRDGGRLAPRATRRRGPGSGARPRRGDEGRTPHGDAGAHGARRPGRRAGRRRPGPPAGPRRRSAWRSWAPPAPTLPSSPPRPPSADPRRRLADFGAQQPGRATVRPTQRADSQPTAQAASWPPAGVGQPGTSGWKSPVWGSWT